MTGVEMIVAALAAGAGAGVKDTAKAAVADAYTAWKGLRRRRLTGREQAQQALDAVETGPNAWRAQLGEDLTASGADRDAEILATARRLLTAADPDGVRAGKYQVEVSGGQDVQIGDGSVHVDTNYGATASQMTGPVTINYGQRRSPRFPPAAP